MIFRGRIRVFNTKHDMRNIREEFPITMKSKFKVLHDFEDDFDLKILQPTKLSKPPGSPGVPLMWCQEFYSLRKAYDKRDKGNMIPLAYTTIRHLRSAASQYCALDAIVSDPSGAVLTKDQKVLFQRCRPTDSLISSLFAKGMLSRLGDESKPSVALLDCHIRELDRELNAMYYAAESPLEKRDLALAGFANLALWLGWLRSSECFDAEWTDISAVEPHQSARHDLPPDSGLVQFRLAPETKSDLGRTADVIMAYRTRSGLCIGKWFHRAKRWRIRPTGPTFCHPDGTPWSSKFFRDTYLYPSLYRQRAAGDPLLAAMTGAPGTSNSIESRFWSLHCYRRGGRSHVSRGGWYGGNRLKRAKEAQVYEHGRWRTRRSTEPMAVSYREWKPRDRLAVTLNCH